MITKSFSQLRQNCRNATWDTRCITWLFNAYKFLNAICRSLQENTSAILFHSLCSDLRYHCLLRIFIANFICIGNIIRLLFVQSLRLSRNSQHVATINTLSFPAYLICSVQFSALVYRANYIQSWTSELCMHVIYAITDAFIFARMYMIPNFVSYIDH